MPEVITKHPDVVKKVLESAGARCGEGAPQQILTECPRESFCALPGGEICVFAVGQIPQMTQLSRAELCAPRAEAPATGGGTPLPQLGAAALLPALGLLVAAAIRRLRR